MAADLAAIGVTNQRETTVVWNPKTGQPWYNAIVWQDTRTDRIVSALDRGPGGRLIRERTGLPPATYFSGGKLQWILQNVDGVRAAAARGEAVFGTVDSWVIWNLTGGPDGGAHVTDVTNASRTMLMDLRRLEWDDELLKLFDIPREMLPSIRASSDPASYGSTRRTGPLRGEVPVSGALGDQQAATLGQVCTRPGEAKNTYGTGNFMLLNTGTEVVPSKAGLLTTVCYKLGDADAIYALEGSIAVTGSAVQWLRDQLGIIKTAAEIEALALTVEDTGGAYFVPAFSGLFAPYWRSDARGAIVGLSRFHNSGAPRARDARSDLLPDARRARRDGVGLGRAPRAAEGRRRRNRQRHAHAAPGRRPRRPRRPARRRGNHRARRRLRRRPRNRLLEGSRSNCARTGRPIASGSRDRRSTSASRAIAAGRRRWSGRSIGLMWGKCSYPASSFSFSADACSDQLSAER